MAEYTEGSLEHRTFSNYHDGAVGIRVGSHCPSVCFDLSVGQTLCSGSGRQHSQSKQIENVKK